MTDNKRTDSRIGVGMSDLDDMLNELVKRFDYFDYPQDCLRDCIDIMILDPRFKAFYIEKWFTHHQFKGGYVNGANTAPYDHYTLKGG